MHNFGSLIRKLRLNKQESLRKTAAFLEIDPALLSKIERGHRRPSRAQVEMLTHYFNADERTLLVVWLSEGVYQKLLGEKYAEEALKLAEQRIRYESKNTSKG